MQTRSDAIDEAGFQITDEDFGDLVNSAAEEAKAYLDAEKRYVVLSVQQAIAKAVGSLISHVLSAVAVVLCLLFASIALAFWLGTMFNSTAAGFLITAGIYLVAFLILHYTARTAIGSSVMLNILNSFYDEED